MRNKFIKTNKNNVFHIFIILFLIILAGFTLYAAITVSNYQTKASVVNVSPIKAPYVRLVKLDNDSFSKEVVVDVLLHTNNQPTLELGLSLVYNPKILKFEKDKTQNYGQYKTISIINEIQNGKLQISLFSTTDAGHDPFISNQEIKVAGLFFQVLDTSVSKTDIVLEFDGQDIRKTALIPYQLPRPEKAKNILKSALGIEIIIKGK